MENIILASQTFLKRFMTGCSMSNIINIEENEEHVTSEVICVKCYHRWLAVRPYDTLLKCLECPECHTVGTVIETGQDMTIK